jgi:hypothetical protein
LLVCFWRIFFVAKERIGGLHRSEFFAKGKRTATAAAAAKDLL